MTERPPKAPPIPPYPGLEVTADEIAWSGRFALQLVRFTYERFDGSRSAELVWELWRRGRGVAILPYDPVADAVVLIEQFRLPALAAGLVPVMTECPAGLLEQGEDPELAGRRELQEETGLVGRQFESIGQYMLMQGGCDETMHYFAAHVTLPESGPATHGLAQEGEDIRLRILPAADAFALLDANRIQNVTAAACLWWLRHHRERLRAAWR
ncbi:NUDIX domain-containing protein [Siccirubricoccus sp. KC 17139]|uniref:ADP-ribose pyrophosphatase n=1 Tax=Siccirubricoccus soli TaxID=2899147 RepID=A0ABT1D9N6_9PROT|nr:NUDIX domain-containing protein [Siccirubricoccus soli]MCO6418644.1 NUDIX domain-containing protein [Siccirubricoccus soli]MCP2684779.1 NUDIX domain-containing protein [Siccirubricoccus soli]